MTKLEVGINAPRRQGYDEKKGQIKDPQGYSLALKKFGFSLLAKKLLAKLQGNWSGFSTVNYPVNLI